MKFLFKWLTFTVGLAIIGSVIASIISAWDVVGPFNRMLGFIIGLILMLAGGILLCIKAMEN
jgi:uncharacterized membrane protein required for colicin V production